jgi:hypothetical protein
VKIKHGCELSSQQITRASKSPAWLNVWRGLRRETDSAFHHARNALYPKLNVLNLYLSKFTPPMRHDSVGKAMVVFGWIILILAAMLIYALTRDM